MLVYGDVEELRDARSLQVEVTELLRKSYGEATPVERHSTLVSAFLLAADLVGGLLDRVVTRTGEDALTPAAEIGSRALVAIAAAIDISWRSGLLDATRIETARDLIRTLSATGTLRLKPLEGYAHYAVYPESYAQAARRSRLPPTTRVIGIRSIGLSLGAMVAAALKSTDMASVRPLGHPFDRQIALSSALRARILEGEPTHFAIVDEGPGLSGSSFAAVSDWLVAEGVERERVHLFPSHRNEPGRQANEERLRRWRAAPRHHVSMNDLLLGHDGPLERWVSDLVGPLEKRLVDISGGAWRDHVAVAEPVPIAPQWERRKFLAHAGHGQFLVKFAGLGVWGRRKLRVAERLQQSGHSPEVIGMCHGFLVQRWIEAPALPAVVVPRARLIEELALYLHVRSELDMPATAGASLEKLAEMAEYNATEALGSADGAAVAVRLREAAGLQDSVLPVQVDARMHEWEWLVRAGRLIKTDAIDHALAHDFIGPQDIAWDVAGAIVEHALNEREVVALIAALELKSGQQVNRPLLDVLLPCYVAFQLGLWTMSAGQGAAIARRYTDALLAIARAPLDQNAISALTKPSGRSRVALSASPSPSSA